MEYEVRYYYPLNDIKKIKQKLNNIKILKNEGRKYEKTSQFNHPDKRFDFYSKEIDGRFRIRITKDINNSICKLSWKRRLNNTFENDINKEEEVELNINANEYDNLIFITKNVLHMEEVESYERYRTTYCNEEVEIALDEYPFGLAIEIEALKIVNDSENIVRKYIELLKLNNKRKFKLSWDDKYEELCKEQGIEQFKHVEFNKKMPQVK